MQLFKNENQGWFSYCIPLHPPRAVKQPRPQALETRLHDEDMCSTVYFLGLNSSLLFHCTEAVKLQKNDPCEALPLCSVKKKTTSNFDKESLKTGFSKDDLWKRLVEVSYEKRHGNIVCLKNYIETHGLGTMKLNF